MLELRFLFNFRIKKNEIIVIMKKTRKSKHNSISGSPCMYDESQKDLQNRTTDSSSVSSVNSSTSRASTLIDSIKRKRNSLFNFFASTPWASAMQSNSDVHKTETTNDKQISNCGLASIFTNDFLSKNSDSENTIVKTDDESSTLASLDLNDRECLGLVQSNSKVLVERKAHSFRKTQIPVIPVNSRKASSVRSIYPKNLINPSPPASLGFASDSSTDSVFNSVSIECIQKPKKTRKISNVSSSSSTIVVSNKDNSNDNSNSRSSSSGSTSSCCSHRIQVENEHEYSLNFAKENTLEDESNQLIQFENNVCTENVVNIKSIKKKKDSKNVSR
jgi:hypothetical protein